MVYKTHCRCEYVILDYITFLVNIYIFIYNAYMCVCFFVCYFVCLCMLMNVGFVWTVKYMVKYFSLFEAILMHIAINI
jgi:hypothetical protein